MKSRKSKFAIGQSKRSSKGLSVIAKRFRKELIKNQTQAERKFREYLEELKLKFEFQKIIYAGTSFYIVDYYLNKYKYAIEIDGGYHDEQKDADINRMVDIMMVGVKGIIRFRNEEVFNEDNCIEKLKSFIL